MSVWGRQGLLCFGDSDSDNSRLEVTDDAILVVGSYPRTGKVERVWEKRR